MSDLLLYHIEHCNLHQSTVIEEGIPPWPILEFESS
jgi:hypothetical protein